MQHSFLLLLLISAVFATLYVQASGDQSLFMQMVWWLTIALGLTFLGWTIGLMAVVP